MPDTNLIGAGFGFGAILLVISLVMFILACGDYNSDNRSSASAGIAAWILLFGGAISICTSTAHDRMGRGWSTPPVEGKYRVMGERQGHIGLAPIDEPDYKAVGHDFDPRTVDFVEVMPDDERANTAEVIGPEGHHRVTVYIIKQVKNPEPNPEKEKPANNP